MSSVAKYMAFIFTHKYVVVAWNVPRHILQMSKATFALGDIHTHTNTHSDDKLPAQ